MQIGIIVSGQPLGMFSSPEDLSAALIGRGDLSETTFELHFQVPANLHLIHKDGSRTEIATDAEGRANLVVNEDGELVVLKNEDGITTMLTLNVQFANMETDTGFVMPTDEFSKSAELAQELIQNVRERIAGQIFDRQIC